MAKTLEVKYRPAGAERSPAARLYLKYEASFNSSQLGLCTIYGTAQHRGVRRDGGYHWRLAILKYLGPHGLT